MKITIKEVSVMTRRSQGKSTAREWKDRLYVYEESERPSTVLNMLQERHNKPYTFYRKLVIPAAIQWLISNGRGEDAVLLQSEKWIWSQKCGCECGCSPGFIGLNNWMRRNISIRFEVEKVENL